jgi:hypothetical protein
MRLSLPVLLVLALTAPQAPGLADALNEYVNLFAGPGAIDCGQSGSPADATLLQPLVDCGLAAARRHQPFRSAQRSWNIAGLIGNANGVVYQYRMSAGAPAGTDAPSFSLRRCPNPSIDRGEVVCDLPANRADALQKPEEYLLIVTGASSTDCGRLGIRAIDGDVRRALDCAFEAQRRKNAFTVVKQNQGIDSEVYEGLVGDRAGTLYRFTYDSGPCGNPECFGSFSLGKCPAPTTSMTGTRLQFSCSR